MYEPQSVEGAKGFPERGPRDRHIAGAERFHELDQYGPARWARVDLADNLCLESADLYRLSIRWRYTTAHATEAYHLYATDATYDSTAEPLTRAHLRHVQTVHPRRLLNNGVVVKGALQAFEFIVPKDFLHRRGSLLIIWDIADTKNAFYQVIDYKLDREGTNRGGGSGTSDDDDYCLDRAQCFGLGYAKNRCDCRRFYRCWKKGGEVSEHVCPRNLVYDERSNQCNWRDRTNVNCR